MSPIPDATEGQKKPDPGRMFFDRNPDTWQDLEEMVRQAFDEMGYESTRGHELSTVRGKARVDVFAKEMSTPIPTIVLCECKYWDTSVDQNVVHAFRTVCADAGAHFGLIISRKGFQSGAIAAAASTNVHLLDFQRFQDTFFDEWKSGIAMRFAWMRDKLFPISPFNLDLPETAPKLGYRHISQKYEAFWGSPSGMGRFVVGTKFPITIVDPRGEEASMPGLEVTSHRQYFEVAKEAYVEVCKRFGIAPDLKPPSSLAQ